jgi:hypothetical protein
MIILELFKKSKEHAPVTIHTNPYYRGATIYPGVKSSLPTTQMPFDSLRMWENDKTLRTKAVRDWVKNTLIPTLQDRGRLKPMLVWRRGNQYYVIDGNHRYLAYKAAGFHGDVPVRVVPDDMVSISNKVGEINEDSPDTPAGSRTKDLNLGKLWLLTELKRLGMDEFDTVYVLGSWYGSMGPYLLDKHIKFDTAYLIDIDPKNTEWVQDMTKKLGINDRIIAVTQDCNTTDFKGDRVLVINTSCNDIENLGWFDNVPQGATVALEGRDSQPDNATNTTQDLDTFHAEYALEETYVLDKIKLKGYDDSYNRFLKIGVK